jgi:dihydroorotate dehydrogenase
MYDALKPLLFKIDPERAHHLGLASLSALAKLGPANPLLQRVAGTPTEVMGLHFPNAIGLAAGLDKDGTCIDGLASLGFGFIEIGTVTPRAQPGNPRPRLFRLPESEAIINRMGFNNAGIDALIARVKSSPYQGILGINIGKNKDTPVELALEDYLMGLRKAYPVASYITVNISSPNTPGLRALQQGDHLDQLLNGLSLERETLKSKSGRKVPLVVKIAPDLSQEEIESIADSLVRYGIDGIIATNTTSSREGVEQSALAKEAGGLSGKPVLEKSNRVVEILARFTQGKLPIIACGGIFKLEDAQRKIDLGASLVQVYSGFIYRGPALIKELASGLRP